MLGPRLRGDDISEINNRFTVFALNRFVLSEKNMSTKRDYYEILGLTKDVSSEEIKKAFRRLAMKHHPDRNPDDAESEAKFKEAKEAYEILMDDNKRQAYDRFGHAAVDGSRGGGAGFGDIFGDMFSDIFGGGRANSNRAQAGASLRYRVELSLEDAIYGIEKELDIPKLVECEECHGSGAKKGTTPKECKTCHGQGQLQMQQGFFMIQQTCPACQGEGMIKEPCRGCRGQGRVEKAKKLKVKIPAGVDEGDRIRVGGEGEAGLNGGPAGDLYIEVSLKKHAIFERDGNDLHCEVPVSFIHCVLGGEVEVPTIDGKATISIPAETQSGKVFRLRGKGIKSVRSNVTGDLFCQVMIETPVNLTETQKELLRQFDNSVKQDNQQHSPRSKSWFDKVKSFFERV